MQYPVPQFTDVEDKIIGSLAIKQFFIVFGAGAAVFLIYMISKSLTATILAGIIAGLPAVALAFVPFNGRPIYRIFPVVVRSLTSPKAMVFCKEAPSISVQAKVKNVETAVPERQGLPVAKQDTQARLREVYRLLEQQSREEGELIKKGNQEEI